MGNIYTYAEKEDILKHHQPHLAPSLFIFKELAQENAKYLLPSQASVFPLNQNQVKKWVNIHSNPIDHRIATIISENIQHISFAHVKKLINQLAQECNTFIQNRPIKPTKIYLLLTDTLAKSNFWITLLAVPLFQFYFEVVDEIHSYSIPKDHNNMVHDVVVIYMDDMSYSGTQIQKNCPFLRNIENYTFILFLLGITDKAQQYIIDKCDLELTFLPSTLKFPSIYTIFTEIAKPPLPWHDIPEYWHGKEMNVQLDQALVYFDHKLADHVSVPINILRRGNYIVDSSNPHRVEYESMGSLIQGCGNQDINPYIPVITQGVKYTYQCSVALQNSLYAITNDSSICASCPPTYYKLIPYTYKGQLLDSNQSIWSFLKTYRTHTTFS